VIQPSRRNEDVEPRCDAGSTERDAGGWEGLDGWFLEFVEQGASLFFSFLLLVADFPFPPSLSPFFPSSERLDSTRLLPPFPNSSPTASATPASPSAASTTSSVTSRTSFPLAKTFPSLGSSKPSWTLERRLRRRCRIRMTTSSLTPGREDGARGRPLRRKGGEGGLTKTRSFSSLGVEVSSSTGTWGSTLRVRYLAREGVDLREEERKDREEREDREENRRGGLRMAVRRSWRRVSL
jgi:hypothetical protein